ncbi:aldo/keto reductase [Paractinoplanes lichenicola]|uniref:Aldo/keto reductase n=1 Tax=Paractinoplanes lichenicola TaxID=2802976 RepID=A0ABS1VEB5_9ACTN|nr:aldo/keto reductase [Actinoplanes lichenicola]MBL7252965.1 aldo/keto reductase [Actinoplanes lichenicola]
MTEIVLGAMLFGTTINERDSHALLDRFVELGGRWIDTSNNYAFWLHPSGLGGHSERVIGSWLAARPGMRDRVLISTKVGAEPTDPARGLDAMEGLSAATIRQAMTGSLERLGVDHVDMYWAHVEDRSVPLAETAGAFEELRREGLTRRTGASNTPAWRVEQARGLGCDWSALQLRHSYVQPRPGAALESWSHRQVFPETLDYVRSTSGLDLWAYSPLINGAYGRADRPLEEAYNHPGTDRRTAALIDVARELGVTQNQVVLAWLLGGDPQVWPMVGASTVDRLDEVMAARDVKLDSAVRDKLDTAN